MNHRPVKIVSVGKAVPKTVITNDDLTKILDTSDEWISTRTGIKQRYIASGDENSTQFGIEAAKDAQREYGDFGVLASDVCKEAKKIADSFATAKDL